jgi:hypothetical protein
VVAQPPAPPPAAGVLPPKAGSASGSWPTSTVAQAPSQPYPPLPAAVAPPRPCHWGFGFHGADYMPPGDEEYANVVARAPPGDAAAAAALARRLTLTLRAPGALPGAWYGPALPAAYRVKLVHTPVPLAGPAITRLPLLPPRTATTLPDRDANSSAPVTAVCGCDTFSPAVLAALTGGGANGGCVNLPPADSSSLSPLGGLLGALWALPSMPSTLVTPYMFNASAVVPLFNATAALLQADNGTPVSSAAAVAAQSGADALAAGRVLPASVSDDLTTLTLPVYRLPGFAQLRDANWLLLIKPVVLVPVTTGVDEPLGAAGGAASAATALTPREPPWALVVAVPSATPPTTLTRTPTRSATRSRTRTGSRTRTVSPTRSRTPPQTRSPSRSPPPRLASFTTPSRSKKFKAV